MLFFAIGIVFALFYGWVVLLLMRNVTAADVPYLFNVSSWPVPPTLAYAVIGAAFGLAHGGVVALFLAIAVLEHHPIERYRTSYGLVASQWACHVVYGLLVMILAHWLLPAFGAPLPGAGY